MVDRPWLLALPFPLIASTAVVFATLSRWLGADAGYLLGFAFYWVVWCYGVPLLLLGKAGFRDLFHDRVPLFTRRNAPVALLLALITLITVVTYFIPELGRSSWTLLLLAIPIEIIQGTGEEVVWRGLYLRGFPDSWLWGWLYPAAAFALWHLSPAVVFPSEGGSLGLVLSAFALGLAYGWMARRSGSIRWVALSHVVNGILAFGIPLSSSLQQVIAG